MGNGGGPLPPPVPVDELPPAGPGPEPSGAEEAKFFDDSELKLLDLSVRRWVSYGALITAAILYLAGLVAIAAFWYGVAHGYVTAPLWPFYVTTLVALFSVPTGLVVGVLRSNSRSSEREDASTLNEAVGAKLLDVVTGWASSSKP
jgi:hypothetical protein